MATFTVTSVSRCGGGNHVEITATVNGVAGRVFRLMADDLLELPDGVDVQAAALVRLRSAILESGATTPVQQRNAILNNTYKV